MKNELKSLYAFTLAGVVFGYVGFVLNKSLNSSVIPLASAIVFFYAMTFVLNKMLKINEKAKWFLTNGGFVYFSLWFITWILFYNVM